MATIYHNPNRKSTDKGIRVSDCGNALGKAPEGWYFQTSEEDMDGNRGFDGPYPDKASCERAMENYFDKKR